MRVGDVVRARREHVEGQPAARAAAAPGGAQRAQALVVGVQVQIGAERAGDERDALSHRRIREVPDPQVDEVRDAGRRGGLRADLEHAARRVDADHLHAGGRRRDRDPPGADAELDDRPAGLARELDVEVDVLDHAPGPRVVQPAIAS